MIRKIFAASVMLAAMQGCGSDSDTGPTENVTKGPGAALKCMSSGNDAFDTYGADAFVAVNKAIVANAVAELTANGTTNLGDSFTKVGSGTPPSTTDDMATFEGKLAAFLVYAYGGPESITYSDGKTYSGLQNMTVAHVGLGITSDQYDYFLTNQIVPALTASGVPETDISSCFAPILTDATFKASIVGK